MIRPGAIGDLIVSLPALEFARAGYTEIWAPARNIPLIRCADRVRSLQSVGLDLLELGFDPPAKTLLRHFDSVISWYGTTRPEFHAAVAGLPFRFYPALPATGQTLHAVDFYMRQVGGPDGAVPCLPVGGTRSRDFIAIHPFSGSARKNWPLERFRQLASTLPLPVAFTAGPEEAIEGALRFDDLGELADWLAGARVYVGNDSGITHLAAAVGVPVVAIFCATDPAVWGPRGHAPVRILNGMPDIETVRAAVVDLTAR